MAKISAGLLPFRRRPATPAEVLIVHPGGPFFRHRDEGAWSIPKGEVEPGEDLLSAARREVWEETGWRPTGQYIALGHVRQRGGKLVYAWAVAADVDPRELKSNSFVLEWPPHSGRLAEFPEIDRASYFGLDQARRKLTSAQAQFVDELERLFHSGAV